jgi:hypothetical protein
MDLVNRPVDGAVLVDHWSGPRTSYWEFDLGLLRVHLIFDRSESGVVEHDDVGFRD